MVLVLEFMQGGIRNEEENMETMGDTVHDRSVGNGIELVKSRGTG